MDHLINKITLGTVQFGLDYGVSNKSGKTPPDEVSKILSYCGKVGIDTLDTAYAYGESQKVLGENDLKGFKLISKFLPEDNNTPSLDEQIDRSLSNLNIQSLYGLLAHRPMDVVKNPDQWAHLMELKNKKIVQKVGFSFNELEELDSVLENGLIPDLVQVPFNYFDNRFKTILQELKSDFSCEVYTRSAFLQGLFFMNVDKLPDFFDPVKNEINRLQQSSRNLPGFLLKYALGHSFIDKVVIGVNNLEQLKENIDSLKGKDNGVDKQYERPANYPIEILSPSKWPKS